MIFLLNNIFKLVIIIIIIILIIINIIIINMLLTNISLCGEVTTSKNRYSLNREVYCITRHWNGRE